MNNLKIIFTLFFFLIACVSISAQEIELPAGITENQILSEIQKRGLDIEEVTAALLKAGIDINNVENLSVEQLPEIQRIIDELTAEKANQLENLKKNLVAKEEVKEIIKEEVPKVIKKEVSKIDNIVKSTNIYGHRMFRNKEIAHYSNEDGIRAPDYYVLGTGDELSISIFGNSYNEGSFIINKSGYIKILDGKKRILLKGLTLAEARKKIRRVYQSYYVFTEGEFNLSLNYSRPISITIYGEVMNQGAFTIPALNNVFNALAAADGPSAIGSIRNIKVHKKNGTVVEVDLFEYINNPSNNKSFYLSDNDMIIVPVAKTIVNVNGEVNRPMLYELKEGEGIGTLIKFSGGFTKKAYTKSLKVNRVYNNEKTFVDIDFSNHSHFKLKNGDQVLVKEISSNLINFVNIIGEVESPGQYERVKGMRLIDLVNKAGIKKESRTDLVFLKRVANDKKITYTSINLDRIINEKDSTLNLILEDKDELTVWAKEIFVEKGYVHINGAIRTSTNLELNGGENLNVKDAIQMSGGLREDASTRGLIFRQHPLKKNEIQYIKLNLNEGIESEDGKIALIANDSIFIYSENNFIEQSFITISGAVTNGGSFQYGKGMELKDLLLLANGTLKSAAKNRIEVSRILTRNNQPTEIVIAIVSIDDDFNIIGDNKSFVLEPYDKVFVRFIPDFEMQKTIYLNGEVKYPGEYPIININETILDVINRAGGLSEEAFSGGATLFRTMDEIGYIVVRLDEVIENNKSKFNFKLRDGDIIEIPKLNDFVTIIGATKAIEQVDEIMLNRKNTMHVPYQSGKNAMYYINEYAGGLLKKADKNNITVRYANGSLKSSKNYVFFRSYPKVNKGATIVVGYKKLKKIEKEKTNIDWNKIVSNTMAQATTLLTLLLVTKNLNN